MNHSVGKCVKLDALTVRPYLTLKNLCLFLGMGVVWALLFQNAVLMITTASMCALLFSGYPFMVGEESGIDPLYKLFGFDAKDVVRGRFVSAFLFTGLLVATGAVFALLVALIYSEEISMLLSGAIGMFYADSLIIFAEYPVYFKLGYYKGKKLSSIPYYVLFGLVLLLVKLPGGLDRAVRFCDEHTMLVIALLLAVWAALLAVSYRLSIRFYSKRDF